jgi:hypothetical protein
MDKLNTKEGATTSYSALPEATTGVRFAIRSYAWLDDLSVGILVSLLIIGTVGNVLAFLTMNIMYRKQVVVAFHFKSLAVVDLFAVGGMTYAVVRQTVETIQEIFGNAFCKCVVFYTFYFYGVSMWCVVTLTMDRVIAVCFPLKTAIWCTIWKARFLFVLNIFIHIPIYMTSFWSLNGPSIYCEMPAWFPVWVQPLQDMLYNVIDTAFPLLLVLTGNIVILITLHQNSRDNTKKGIVQKKKQVKDSPTVMLLTISFVFIICIMAYPIDQIVWAILIPGSFDTYEQIRAVSFIIAIFVSNSNNVFNFYLYLLSSGTFRETFRKMCAHICKFSKGKF